MYRTPLGDASAGLSETPRGQPSLRFSIIVPAFNREDTIERCLESCFCQDHDRFEVVVIDDASTDRTVELLERITDPRLKIIKLSENRQVSYARNEGSRAARGEWLIYLDSDDALLPDCLKRLETTIAGLEPDISVIGCPYLHDDGPMSPAPLPDKEVLEFVDYLQWRDRIQGSSDWLTCRRRATWERIPWPNTRARQALTLFRLYSNYKMRMLREPYAMVYADARNRHTSDASAAAKERWKLDGRDIAESRATLLKEFGSEMKEHCPRSYVTMQRSVMTTYFFAGCRWLGLRHSLRYLSASPLAVRGWIILALGLVGPGAIIWATGKRRARKAAPTTKADSA